ncbi:hypothetical protein CDFC105_41367 [Clostridioides difficile]|nr:hypothetical protein [Clostridioides difficile]MCW0800797.1 hypothetical protein [Clostridioides difficile]MDB9633148.1 hypothetical protein [Clostridioides difficile]MDM0140410.1 hypothetical protein [Clostridioides difficile]MDM9919739.1 hypothetical protein [Clostridioides difficile]CZR78173.1 hypothetical protein CDFC105_41367 [Clostridioides difficile]
MNIKSAFIRKRGGNFMYMWKKKLAKRNRKVMEIMKRKSMLKNI